MIERNQIKINKLFSFFFCLYVYSIKKTRLKLTFHILNDVNIIDNKISI